MDFKKFFIVIAGPTGVGKTDTAIELAQRFNGAIINGDMGQLYTPLTIGTAKPDWRKQMVPHYLFDVIDGPERCSAAQYRTMVLDALNTVWAHNQIPLIVGGSHFYIQSLLYPVHPMQEAKAADARGPENEIHEFSGGNNLWQELYAIDPERAQKIHKNDTYRIKRALAIWYSTGKKPSSFERAYNPPSPFYFIFLTRDRHDLYARINSRVEHMMNQGWIDEVRSLMNTPWQEFLLEKKIIGYDDIIRFLKIDQATIADYQQLIETIAQKTRNYAKRQMTYWRMLEKKLIDTAIQNMQPKPYTATFNLTLLSHDLYINQLATLIMKEM